MSNTPLTIKVFTEPIFGENAYVLSTAADHGAKVGWVIDPGFSPQVEELLEYLDRRSIVLEKVLLTHGHLDHVAGLDAVRAAHPQTQVLMARPDQPMLGDAELNMSAPFGVPLVVQARADGDLTPQMELPLGPLLWRVLDTSGHSPGGRSFHCPSKKVVFTGDALFAGSVGRCDIPGADYPRLLANLHAQLLSLPDDTVVYSGHGPKTTIGNERKSNPFLSDA